MSACAAGTDAIGGAARLIARGRRRWMLAGGADSMINPLGVAGFCSIGAMSTSNDEPARASRPFDRRRNGFVLGEGAAMLVLERQSDAEARGARIYAEIAGYGTSFDAHGISEPHPEGRGAFQAMSRALDGRRCRALGHRLHQRARDLHAEERPRRDAGHQASARRARRTACRSRRRSR